MFVKAITDGYMHDGKIVGMEISGKQILIAKIDGLYYAIENLCAHRGCRLSNGFLKGDEITCPCHGSVFNIKTGKLVKGPATKSQKSFATKLEDSWVLVDI
jgi:nitrite reductase/ring-hydroxylating ferredoxin subunit